MSSGKLASYATKVNKPATMDQMRMGMKVAGRSGIGALALAAVAASAATAPPGLVATRIGIDRNGARSNDVSGEETAAACARFRLTRRDVWTYLTTATRVDARAFHHDLSMSRCHARGTVTLADGRRARWFIDLERRGALYLTGGRTLYFYCGACTARAYDEADAEDIAIAASPIPDAQGDDRP